MMVCIRNPVGKNNTNGKKRASVPNETSGTSGTSGASSDSRAKIWPSIFYERPGTSHLDESRPKKMLLY